MRKHNRDKSLYAIATVEMKRLIAVYLRLTAATTNFSNVTADALRSPDACALLAAGIGVPIDTTTPEPRTVLGEWQRRQAIPFDVEAAVTSGVYQRLREASGEMYDSLETLTHGFRSIQPELLTEHPEFLPFLQHIGGVFSKAQLKRKIGAATDSNVSGPAARRLIDLLASRIEPGRVRKEEVLRSLDTTLEGIVRDLVGRVLLESVVASALEAENLSVVRESQYSSLAGVVYDFRADFVLPSASEPKVFIEVRKSSSRHASLYAKDKMFSAINWKGRHPDLLGILVVDGSWTGSTLQVMAKVFDYVAPLGRVPELAKTVSAYLRGDKSKLKWLIDFRISENK